MGEVCVITARHNVWWRVAGGGDLGIKGMTGCRQHEEGGGKVGVGGACSMRNRCGAAAAAAHVVSGRRPARHWPRIDC